MSLPTGDDFMKLLSNREQVLSTILGDLSTCAKNAESFEKLASMIEGGREVDARKATLAMARSLKHLNESNRRALTLLLVYASGPSYSGDAAQVAVKMGKGEDALRELFKQKMGGR